MSTALRLLADGRGDAVVSTGNTGALFTGATLIVRKIKGVRRAAIASILPMSPPVLLLDSGANVVVTDEYIEQFAIMGSIFMHKVYGLQAPRVGLLNNGAEECKGTELQLKSYRRLSELPGINFVGNVEADKLSKNACDVLVTDGFTGNILLKCVEGMGKMMLSTMKDIFYADTVSKISGLLIKARSQKIVNGLKLADAQQAENVCHIIANRYFLLNDIHETCAQQKRFAKDSVADSKQRQHIIECAERSRGI